MRFGPKTWVIAGVVIVAAAVSVKAQESPYAGLQHREIKALSTEDRSGYLAGSGMGFAMAAELNSYPGPKHVLELAGSLDLGEEQLTRTRAAYDRMHQRAVRLGAELVAAEGDLDALFANGKADDRRLKRIVSRIATLRGELRLTHLAAHVEMRRILTDEQIARYDGLRGYGCGGQGHVQHVPHDGP